MRVTTGDELGIVTESIGKAREYSGRFRQVRKSWHSSGKYGKAQVMISHKRLGGSLHNRENGSLIPLMLGIFSIVLTIYIVGVNIYSLENAKLNLERWGEGVVADLYQEIAYEKYFFESQDSYYLGKRSFVPVDCINLLTNLRKNFRQYAPTRTLLSADCQSGQIEISVATNVKLPFIPQLFSDFQPQVVAHIKGGLQRVRSATGGT